MTDLLIAIACVSLSILAFIDGWRIRAEISRIKDEIEVERARNRYLVREHENFLRLARGWTHEDLARHEQMHIEWRKIKECLGVKNET